MTPEEFADHLDRQILTRLGQLRQSEVFRVISATDTSPRLVMAIVKFVLLEVFSYGPHVTEATFTAIGRFPKDRPDLMRPLILHDLEEVNHGEMALKDFVRLGGDEQWARSRRITPESFAMAATCRLLATHESPFAFLGYMYPFEAMTPTITDEVKKLLAAKMFPVAAQGFIDVHAEEDVLHARALRDSVIQIVREFPDAASAIQYGFECFTAVYPLPIWGRSLEFARAECASS